MANQIFQDSIKQLSQWRDALISRTLV